MSDAQNPCDQTCAWSSQHGDDWEQCTNNCSREMGHPDSGGHYCNQGGHGVLG